MNEHKVIDFIHKTIDKTNRNELKWSAFKEDYPLIKDDMIDTPNQVGNVIINSLLPKLDRSRSLYTAFGNNLILLLYYTPNLSSSNEITLSLQNDTSPIRKKMASSNDNSIEIASQVKRLYNLALDHASNFDSFIDDFLNS